MIIASPLSKPGTNLALALCAILFCRDWLAGRTRPRSTPLDPAIAAWVAASLISATTSIDPLRSFRDLRSIGHWGAYYFTAWAVAGGASLAWLENLWLAAGCVTAAHALVQQATGFDLLGRASSVPTGFFGGHLELGHYMVVLLGLALVRFADATEKKERQLLLLAIVAFGGALVVSQGRGPWLALVAVLVCWGWTRPTWRVLAVLALLFGLQVLFFARQPDGLEAFYRSYAAFERDEPSPVSDLQLRSNRWRVEMWREGLRFFALRPLTGTGVETTGGLSPEFRTPFPDLAVAHLHSNYFEILMTRGFFGLAAFFVLLIVASREIAASLGEAPPGPRRAALFAALAAIVAHLVHGLTHFTVGSSWIQIGFYIALGLGMGETLERTKGREAPRIHPHEVAWALLAIAAAFAVVPWLEAHPSVATLLAATAALDCATRWVLGDATPLEGALAASFAFIVVASVILLDVGGESRELGLRVILACAAAYAVSHAAARLASLVVRQRRPAMPS